MVTFLFIRHGLSVTNNSGRFTGQEDVPLHERGLRQAQDLALYLPSRYAIDCIYASTSSRAYDTALPTANALHLPIIKMDTLREIDVGSWGGRTYAEIIEQDKDAFLAWRENVGLARYGDGENAEEAQRRILKSIQEIAEQNDGKTVLVATHGGVLRCLRCAWENIPLAELKNYPIVPNASLSLATYENGTGKFSFHGYDDYLTDKTPHIPNKLLELS